LDCTGVQTAVAVAAFVNGDPGRAVPGLSTGLSMLFCYSESVTGVKWWVSFGQLLSPDLLHSLRQRRLFWGSTALENWVAVPVSNLTPFKRLYPNESAILEFLTPKLHFKLPEAQDCC